MVFGCVEIAIRLSEQCGLARAPDLAFGDADAHRHHLALHDPVPRKRLDRLTDLLAATYALAEVDAGKDEQEFLAAHACGPSGLSGGGGQHAGYLGQHLVTDRMREPVVHLLEMVEIHEPDRQRRAVLA